MLKLTELVPFQAVFAPLRDPERFREVRVVPELGTVVWPIGADLDPLVLYSLITGRELGGAAVCG